MFQNIPQTPNVSKYIYILFFSSVRISEVQISLCHFVTLVEYNPSWAEHFSSVCNKSVWVLTILPNRWTGRTSVMDIFFTRDVKELFSDVLFTLYFHRLGSLGCFFNDFQSLNANLSKKLLSQLDSCDNSEIAKVRTASLLYRLVI